MWKKQIEAAYPTHKPTAAPLTISSPWSPQDTLLTWVIDDTLGALLGRTEVALTREAAMRIPGVARGHGIICSQLAEVPFFQMEGDTRTAEQPEWLTDSRSGVSPYHRMYGAASDWLFNGWACFGFTADMDDCLHIPYGLWSIEDDGTVTCNDSRVPDVYKAKMIAVPLGYGENGLLVNGADAIRQARNIEAAYQQRLENPIPLTVLTIADDLWHSWTPEERVAFRDQWNEGRQKNSTAMKPSSVSVDMPGQIQVDLYETGRNGSRLDIANHLALPASILDAVRQGGGGGGTEMRYQGVANGAERSDLWEYGLAKRMMLAFEARMSMDDIVPQGHSIRGDLTHKNALPPLNTNPTSKD